MFLLRIETFLAVLFVGSVQCGVTARVEGGAALGLHRGRETVFEYCFTFGLVHCGAMFGEGGNCEELSH